MNLKVGDKVKVIAGSSKGKEGKIISFFVSKYKALKNKISQYKKILGFLFCRLQATYKYKNIKNTFILVLYCTFEYLKST